ncbi:unnamed protein product [Schistosoma margrebowiei]|uniref:Trematode Eggshell Synthesis domain containing protein n=1 Tax=Schistosoma margrebowiei TaxID=48269 RepID=A0AA85A6R0_9TREM|nr:unnamed protein product [Schistosoma margrebowiei]
MKLMIWIFLIFVTTVSSQEVAVSSKVDERNFKKDDEKRSTLTENDNSEDESKSNSRKSMGHGLETAIGSGRFKYKYKRMKAKGIDAKGKFRSRGVRGYGMISSEYSQFLIEENLDKYGHAKPIKSKFKTYGKKKKYSKKLVDDQFDTKGNLIEQRKYKQTGNYQANGTHLYIDLQAQKERDEKWKLKTMNTQQRDNSSSEKVDGHKNSNQEVIFHS